MSEELQLVNTRLSTLETAVAELTSVLKKLTTPGNEPSAQATENKSDQSSTEGTVTTAEDGQVNSAEQQGQESTAQAVSDQVPDATGFPTDIQKDFGHIRDTLNRVKLPSTYKLNETSLGVSKKDKPAFTVLQKNSRHIETGPKLLQVAQTDSNLQQSDITHYFEQLSVILQAAIAYNQQEYQAIVVGSTFDQETTKYFRVMQKSENCFSPQALGNLKLAAEIASVSANRQSAGANVSYTSYSRTSPRGRGRGRGNNFYRNRGGNQFSYNHPPYFPQQLRSWCQCRAFPVKVMVCGGHACFSLITSLVCIVLVEKSTTKVCLSNLIRFELTLFLALVGDYAEGVHVIILTLYV